MGEDVHGYDAVVIDQRTVMFGDIPGSSRVKSGRNFTLMKHLHDKIDELSCNGTKNIGYIIIAHDHQVD